VQTLSVLLHNRSKCETKWSVHFSLFLQHECVAHIPFQIQQQFDNLIPTNVFTELLLQFLTQDESHSACWILIGPDGP